MLKEFVDPGTKKRIMVRYPEIFAVTESHNGSTAIVAIGGATIITAIPYLEFRAWMLECEKTLDG